MRRERTATRLQLVSDVSDVVLPLGLSGLVKFDDGIIGLAGTLASAIGVVAQWEKTA